MYQSYANDRKSEKEAEDETVQRLQFSQNNVTNIIMEILLEGNIVDNKHVRMISNTCKKLADEEID